MHFAQISLLNAQKKDTKVSYFDFAKTFPSVVEITTE